MHLRKTFYFFKGPDAVMFKGAMYGCKQAKAEAGNWQPYSDGDRHVNSIIEFDNLPGMPGARGTCAMKDGCKESVTGASAEPITRACGKMTWCEATNPEPAGNQVYYNNYEAKGSQACYETSSIAMKSAKLLVKTFSDFQETTDGVPQFQCKIMGKLGNPVVANQVISNIQRDTVSCRATYFENHVHKLMDFVENQAGLEPARKKEMMKRFCSGGSVIGSAVPQIVLVCGLGICDGGSSKDQTKVQKHAAAVNINRGSPDALDAANRKLEGRTVVGTM